MEDRWRKNRGPKRNIKEGNRSSDKESNVGKFSECTWNKGRTLELCGGISSKNMDERV